MSAQPPSAFRLPTSRLLTSLEFGVSPLLLLFVCLLCLLAVSPVLASDAPRWWTARGVLDSNAVPNDHAPVNQGQAKWMATQAKAELDAVLASGAGPAIEALVGGFSATGNNLPLNLGQLKFLAEPFYLRLSEVGWTNAYPVGMTGAVPWTTTTADDIDYALVNLGQLKYVFSFDPDACIDSDGDGLSNRAELILGTDPIAADTDGDGLSDGMEAGWRVVVAWGDNTWGQCDVPTPLADVVSVSARGQVTAALKSDGSVVVWGDNYYGQHIVPESVVGAIAVAVGGGHVVALLNDGRPVAWGATSDGQCVVPPEVTNAVAVAAGTYHTVALLADGTVAAWGGNNFGQCNIPPGLTGVTAIAAGEEFTVALLSDGTVVAWGRNDVHQCDVPPGLSGAMAIAAGVDHTVALLSDGSVTAWGDDWIELVGPAGLSNATAVAAGKYHSAAVAGGTIWAWGDDLYGQCTVPAGLGPAVRLCAGSMHCAAVLRLDPTRADTDGDGMPDKWEIDHGFNPCDPRDAAGDPDVDGLSNVEEHTAGTDPRDPDTDHDSFLDGIEVANNLNPLVADLDTDGDGMADAWELANGFNLNDPADAAALSSHPFAAPHSLTNLQVFQYPGVRIAADYSSANDGIPDWWKAKYGIDPNDTTAWKSDADGDGRNLAAEYSCGSSPTHNDRIEIKINEVAFTLVKYGFDTFVPTDPPQRYSTKTETWSAHIGGDPTRDIGPGGRTTVKDRQTGVDAVTPSGTQIPFTSGRGQTRSENKQATVWTSTYDAQDLVWSWAVWINGRWEGEDRIESATDNGTQSDSQTLSGVYPTDEFQGNFASWFPPLPTGFAGGTPSASMTMTPDQLNLSAKKIRYKFNLDTAFPQKPLTWLEVFTPADDPTTSADEASNPVEVEAKTWTQGGNETSAYTIDPVEKGKFGTYSIVRVEIDVQEKWRIPAKTLWPEAPTALVDASRVDITIQTTPSGFASLITLSVAQVAPTDPPTDNGTLTRDLCDVAVWHYDAFTEAKTDKHPISRQIEFTASREGVGVATKTISVTSVFEHLSRRTLAIYALDRENAWKYARWKYDIDTINLASIAHKASLVPRGQTEGYPWGTMCWLGGDAFRDENICASTLGHENVHGGQGYFWRWAYPDHSEVEAYLWELNNAPATGISELWIRDIQGKFDDVSSRCNP